MIYQDQVRALLLEQAAATQKVVDDICFDLQVTKGSLTEQIETSKEFSNALAVRTEELRLSKAEVRRMRGLYQEAQQEIVRLSAVRRRGLFVANPNFNAEKDLAGEALLVYKSLWAYHDSEYASVIQKIAAGKMPYSNDPLPEGFIPVRPLRFVKSIVHTLLFMLDHYGDPRALAELKKVIAIVFDPKRMATRYLKGSLADAALEQIGLPRFNHTGLDAGKNALSDVYGLDWNLHTSIVGQAKYALKQNGGGAEYERLKVYTKALVERVTFLATKYTPNRPWYLWGSTLRHPTEARFAWHYFEWLDTGDAEHRKAWEFFGACLEANTERIKLADGSYVLMFSHTVDDYADAMFGDKEAPAAQDITYTQESVPDRYLSMMVGSPFHSREDEAAMARTMHLCALYAGAKSMSIAATIAGYGPVSYTGKRVIFVEGKPIPTKRTTSDRPNKTEHVLQISRGLALLGSSLCEERPQFKAALYDISDTVNAHAYKRYGSRVGLMFYTTSRLN
jgi:hypothetical protein